MRMTDAAPLERAELEEILAGADRARVALLGDLCLDMYWLADMTRSELSRETPHFPLPVVEEHYAPGGAGNAACNIAALRPEKLCVVGIVGMDWRAGLLLRALQERGVDCTYIVQQPGVITNTYIKPMRRGVSDMVYEDPRLDFENRALLSAECEGRLLQALEAAVGQTDVLCVSDQMKYGCVTPKIRERICEMGRQGKVILVDSRDRAALYRFVTVKPNEVEAARAFGSGQENTIEELAALAEQAERQNGRTALLTLGERGCFVAQEGNVVRCPACPVRGQIDFCGAGDTFLAGYATFLAGGATPVQAAGAASVCSAVTIKKLGTTGTASREEVRAAWELYYGGKHA